MISRFAVRGLINEVTANLSASLLCQGAGLVVRNERREKFSGGEEEAKPERVLLRGKVAAFTVI
jgi:hypothetical protein